MLPFLKNLEWLGISGLVEIAVLSGVFYYILIFFRGTRSAQVLLGLVVLLVVLMVVTQFFRLDALSWLLRGVSGYLALALLIIFQPEFRRALAELGRPHVFASATGRRHTIEQVIQAVGLLAQRRIGALVAFEREIGTRAIQETGVKVDSPVTAELLATIFFPHTPLHDGGVIIQGNRIVAAACLFPLAQGSPVSKGLGTRHRAAIGITEETDAMAVVVSEETGTVSVSYRGRLSRDLSEDRLRRFLSAVLLREKKRESALSRFKEQLDLSPEGIARTDSVAKQEPEDAG